MGERAEMVEITTTGGEGVGGGCQKLLKIAFGGVTRLQKLF